MAQNPRSTSPVSDPRLQMARAQMARVQEANKPSRGNPLVEAYAVGEVALASGVSFVASIAAGATATVAQVAAGMDPSIPEGRRMEVVEGVFDETFSKLTKIPLYGSLVEPKSRRGKETMQTVMQAGSKIDEGATWLAATLSLGNPYAATAIKTGLMAPLELLGITRLGKGPLLTGKLKDIQRVADSQGVRLDANHMKADVIAAAERMSETERAANMGRLNQSLRDAAKAEHGAVQAKYAAAEATHAAASGGNLAKWTQEMYRDLVKGGFDFETDASGRVATRLRQMSEAGDNVVGTGKARRIRPGQVPLQEVAIIRKRLVGDWDKNAPPSRNAAITKLRKGLDEFLENEFTNDAIIGDAAAVKRWKEAPEAFAAWRKKFYPDNTLINLAKDGATSNEMLGWLMGASAIGAKAEASRTMGRLVEIFGKESPEIRGIKQDFLFSVAEPLLQTKPSLPKFISGFDRLVQKQPDVVRLLNIDATELGALRKLAITADKLPPNKQIESVRMIIRGLPVLGYGNSLARNHLKLRMGGNVLSYLYGADKVTQKTIWADLTQTHYGQPLLPIKGTQVGSMIAAGVLAEGTRTTGERPPKEAFMLDKAEAGPFKGGVTF